MTRLAAARPPQETLWTVAPAKNAPMIWQPKSVPIASNVRVTMYRVRPISFMHFHCAGVGYILLFMVPNRSAVDPEPPHLDLLPPAYVQPA